MQSKKQFRPIALDKSVADAFSDFSRENGFTVSGGAEKALKYWMEKGYKDYKDAFLNKPSTIEPSKWHNRGKDMAKICDRNAVNRLLDDLNGR